MSCRCENDKMRREYDRIRRLAKAYAAIEGASAVIFRNNDGTYDFCREADKSDKNILEYITPY